MIDWQIWEQKRQLNYGVYLRKKFKIGVELTKTNGLLRTKKEVHIIFLKTFQIRLPKRIKEDF